MNKELIESINKYWQILVFLVFLLGYITFSFYFHMNGLPFIPIEIPLIIGLGLIVLFYTSLIYFFSTTNITLKYKYIYSFVLVSSLNILNNFSVYYILIVLFGFYIANGMHLLVKTESDGTESRAEDKNKKDLKLTYLFLASTIPMLFTMNWTNVLLLFSTLFFINELQLNYKLKKSTNYFGLLMMIIIFPFLISVYINNNGLLPLNLYKQNVKFKTEDKSFSSLMIYQNSDNVYIRDNNHTLSIRKDKIITDINYLEYYKNDTILIDNIKYVRKFFND